MGKKTIVAALAMSASAATLLIAGSAIAQGFGPHGMVGGHERPSFETLDVDGDGKLTVAEMRAHRGVKFSEMDSDGDGSLSVEEMSAVAAERAAEHSSKMISRMIEWRDTDGDGKLSEAELGGDMGERMFAHLDADDDGAISAEEYASMETRGQRFGNGKRDGRGMHGKSGHMGEHDDNHSGRRGSNDDG
jgi:Ca2+-binding EF-hand superfamily protein